MRKNIIFSLVLALCVVVLSFACVKTDVKATDLSPETQKNVMTVSQNGCIDDKVLEARFLNMLNHNFVYNEQFYDDAVLVNNAMLALLDCAENGFIDELVLSEHVYNMYGKIYNDFAFLGENLPEKNGFAYVIPRDYDVYTHQIVSIVDNKDGSFTVKSNATVSYMDGTAEEIECETVFLRNTESAFGYNIMYSEFIESFGNIIEC